MNNYYTPTLVGFFVCWMMSRFDVINPRKLLLFIVIDV